MPQTFIGKFPNRKIEFEQKKNFEMAERVPRIEIVEQPAESELRFRYQCENRASGALMGENWTSTRKTYPTIRMVGYAGTAKVAISLVTVTEPYR